MPSPADKAEFRQIIVAPNGSSWRVLVSGDVHGRLETKDEAIAYAHSLGAELHLAGIECEILVQDAPSEWHDEDC